MIETRNLTVELGGTDILHDITVAMPGGRFTALVGPNGAGKSTLLAAMGRLTAPKSGAVLLNGTPLPEIAPGERAKRLSVLRQDTQIAPRLSVRDLVGFGRYPHSRGRMTPADRAAVDRALLRLDLAPLADRFLDTLSGGQRQRALVAMVLAQETEVILLDEPLNNLDLVHARVVMRIAAEEAAAGKTVIMVLHDLSVAAAYADHVVAMKNGRVEAAGTPDEVLTEPVLTDLYDAPVTVIKAAGHRIVLTV